MAKHALLSASSAKQWLSCPPSARLSEKMEDIQKDYALEGTLAHEVVELYNKLALKQITENKFKKSLAKIQQDELFNDEMLDYAEAFSNFILEKNNELKGIEQYFELKVDYSDFAPDGFGTCDVVLYNDERIVIIDYKYGKGVEVSAEDNPQLKLYALGALNKFITEEKVSPRTLKTVEMIIWQPRINNFSFSELIIEDLLEWGETTVKPTASLAFDGAGDFKSGEHCKFCKIKPICRQIAKDNLEHLKKVVTDCIDTKELSDLLKVLDTVKSWSDSVKEYSLNLALKGENIPDFKVVEGKSNRFITDEKALITELKSEGLTEFDFYDVKLKGLTTLEKLVKDRSRIEPFIEKPKGAPTLAPITDKREDYNSAEEVFKGVDISQYE